MVVDAGSSDRAGSAPDALSGAAAGAGGSSNRTPGKENRTRLETPCDLNLSHVSAGWQREVMDNITENPEIRQVIDTASARILNPRQGECLVCYVFRQLGEFGCNGTHRFAESFRDSTAPRATALLARLGSMGACCCDCEMFLNAYAFAQRPLLMRGPLAEAIGTRMSVEELEAAGALPMDSARADTTGGQNAPSDIYLCCQFVRRGSTQPCGNWRRQRRW